MFLLILGKNINLPYLEWSSDGPSLRPVNTVTDTAKLLSHIMAFMNLKQINTLKNENSRILDLVLCNSPDCSVNISDDPLLKAVPHHPPLDIFYETTQSKYMPTNQKTKRNFYRANYDQINTAISETDWVSELSSSCIDTIVDKFYNKIMHVIESYVPLIKVKTNRFPKWFSNSLIYTLRRKSKMWARWKTYNSLRDYQEFSLLRKRAKRLLIKCYNKYIENVESSIKDNIKYFWKYTSDIKETNTGYPQVMKLGTKTSDDPKIISEMFSHHFKSVFEPLSDNAYTLTQHLEDNFTGINLHDIRFTQLEVCTALKTLIQTKALDLTK
ncbi:unnamed protein product [Parnassius apollo]|uniref:(apollo) hypothetical protein n=1 Tax=Parnassius apollo TaxID=110799 RepID=A0A8S3WEM7_PARAO|nr:unnamed protein product [Parnassius apollo]